MRLKFFPIKLDHYSISCHKAAGGGDYVFADKISLK